jgi:hypothetical protein
MVEETFQLTRVQDYPDDLDDKVYSFSFYNSKGSPYSTFSTLPPIKHSHSLEVTSFLFTKAAANIAPAFERVKSKGKLPFTRVGSPQVTQHLIEDLKSSIAQSFDYQISQRPGVLAESISKLSHKELAQKQMRNFEAKMLELRRKSDSLEKERLRREERLARLKRSARHMVTMGIRHELADQADEIEAKLEGLSKDHSAEKLYTLVLANMAKSREFAMKFCFIRLDKLKESLSRLNHEIKESEKSLLQEQLGTLDLQDKIRKMTTQSQQVHKAKRAEISSVIESYREDLTIDHHITKHQEGLLIKQEIRRKNSKVRLLKRVESRLLIRSRVGETLKLQNSYKTKHETAVDRLLIATKTKDADDVVRLYHTVVTTTQQLSEKKRDVEAQVNVKEQVLKELMKLRGQAYFASEDREVAPRCKLEAEVERRSCEILRREEEMMGKLQLAARVGSGLQMLYAAILEVCGSTDELSHSTDINSHISPDDPKPQSPSPVALQAPRSALISVPSDSMRTLECGQLCTHIGELVALMLFRCQ